ncbi:MAG: secondary thiamine-phosphate synthase enzyme YjbQ [Thermoplasmatota archaeon]
MHEITLRSQQRRELIDVTDRVAKLIEQSGINDGLALMYVPHTTAGVTINEGADPAVQRDILATLQSLVPHDSDYEHAEGNSDAHITSSLIGCTTQVIISDGTPKLGTWQHIFFYEGDGPRTRRLLVELLER